MAVYGGSALALAYDLRAMTKDVDAVFEKDKTFVRDTCAIIAQEMGLPDDWLNDAVKGYVSPKASDNMIPFGSFPNEESPGLRIFVPAPEYFFAMKCVDIRPGAGSQDVEDVKKLAEICGFTTADQALDVVESFYPDRTIKAKTSLVLQEIFATNTFEPGQKTNVGRESFPEKLAQFRAQSSSTTSTAPFSKPTP